MTMSPHNNNNFPNPIWIIVLKGAVAGAVSGVCVHAICFGPVMILIALYEGQWWGYPFRPSLQLLNPLWWLMIIILSAGPFSRFWPVFVATGSISGFLGSVVGILSRRRIYAVVTGVASGMIIGPLIATNVYNNLGMFFLWFMFVGAMAGLLGAWYAGRVPTAKNGWRFSLLLIVLAIVVSRLWI